MRQLVGEPGKRLTSRWTTVAGWSMHALVPADPSACPGPPVVLVHGLGVSGRYMLPTAVRLAGHLPTYVPDLPGFGQSARPAHALDIPELADALAGWTRALGLGPGAAGRGASFLGNSLGCQVIVDLGLRYPELVGRAVLVGSTLDPRARSLLRQIGRGVLDLFRESPSLWFVLLRDYLSAGPLRTLRTLRLALADPLEQKLPRLGAPTLVVRGAFDPVSPQRWAEEMTRLVPRARLAVLPHGPHAANYSTPDALVQTVLPFLLGAADAPRAGVPALR